MSVANTTKTSQTGINKGQTTEARIDNTKPSKTDQDHATTELEALLHDELREKEPIVETATNTQKPNTNTVDPLLPDWAWKNMYFASGGLHALASISGLFKIVPEPIRHILNYSSTIATKVLNAFNYGDKSMLSFKTNNALDSISKLILPLATVSADNKDMLLASGLSSGTTMINFAHNPRIENKKSFWANLQEHSQHYFNFWQEIIANPGKIFSRFDRHLEFFGGNLDFIGGLGVFISEKKHPLLREAFSFLRDSAGIVCAVAKTMHGSKDLLKAGILNIASHLINFVQSRHASDNPEFSEAVGHLVQALYTPSTYYYTRTTESIANNRFDDSVRDKFIKRGETTPSYTGRV